MKCLPCYNLERVTESASTWIIFFIKYSWRNYSILAFKSLAGKKIFMGPQGRSHHDEQIYSEEMWEKAKQNGSYAMERSRMNKWMRLRSRLMLRSTCHLGSWLCPGWAAVKGHILVLDPTTVRVDVNVHGPCCHHQRMQGCPVSGMLLVGV